MTHVHIFAPRSTRRFVHAGTCPDCKKRTRFIGWWSECEYFGPTSFCLRCGREWQEGYWMDLPFVRQSRQKNIAYAKKQWRAIGPAAEAHRAALLGGVDE